MGVSRITAFAIASRTDIETNAAGPDRETGKYIGFITLGPDDRYRVLLSTPPMYDSLEHASQAMKDAVEEIRKAANEELKGRHPIDVLMGDIHEAETVKQIVAGIRSVSKQKGGL